MQNPLNSEPVALVAFVRACLYLAVLFGLDLTTEQLAGIVVVVELGLGLFTRQKVTPA